MGKFPTKTIAIVTIAVLLMSAALADPMHAPKPRGHAPDTPTPNPETLF